MRGVEILFGADEAAADGIIGFGQQGRAVVGKGRKRQGVGMAGQKEPLVHQHVPRIDKGHGPFSSQQQVRVVFQRADPPGQMNRFHAVRLLPLQAAEHRAHGAVPVAGERQGTVKIKLDAGRRVQQAFAAQLVGKGFARQHGTYCVGTGRADADFEQIEHAEHGFLRLGLFIISMTEYPCGVEGGG